MYLLTSSFQTSQGNRPYYHLARFAFGPDVVSESSTKAPLLFPNPAKQFTQLSHLAPNTKLRLFNSMSQEVPVTIFGQVIQWSNLSNGIYFLEIRDDAALQVHRLVIEN
jgi:hypothetical protein